MPARIIHICLTEVALCCPVLSRGEESTAWQPYAVYLAVSDTCLTVPSAAQGPAVTMVRRHSRGSDQVHYGPALQTVSGNYVAAKRKGVVNGVDFGFTGVVGPPCEM